MINEDNWAYFDNYSFHKPYWRHIWWQIVLDQRKRRQKVWNYELVISRSIFNGMLFGMTTHTLVTKSDVFPLASSLDSYFGNLNRIRKSEYYGVFDSSCTYCDLSLLAYTWSFMKNLSIYMWRLMKTVCEQIALL